MEDAYGLDRSVGFDTSSIEAIRVFTNAMHSANRTMSTFANEQGRGRGVAPLTASRARQILTEQR